MLDEITRKRWDANSDAGAHSPRTALLKALADLDEGVENPDHVIILFGKHEADDTFSTAHYQAGSFRNFAQIGLLEFAKTAAFMGSD